MSVQEHSWGRCWSTSLFSRLHWCVQCRCGRWGRVRFIGYSSIWEYWHLFQLAGGLRSKLQWVQWVFDWCAVDCCWCLQVTAEWLNILGEHREFLARIVALLAEVRIQGVGTVNWVSVKEVLVALGCTQPESTRLEAVIDVVQRQFSNTQAADEAVEGECDKNGNLMEAKAQHHQEIDALFREIRSHISDHPSLIPSANDKYLLRYDVQHGLNNYLQSVLDTVCDQRVKFWSHTSNVVEMHGETLGQSASSIISYHFRCLSCSAVVHYNFFFFLVSPVLSSSSSSL